MADETEFPKEDGDVLYSSEANLLNGVMQVYTGTDLNVSSDDSTDENSLELTALTSTQVQSAKYLKISYLVNIDPSEASTGVGEIEYKIQTKEAGGSYADDLAYTTITNQVESGIREIIYIHTLSVGELANGVQAKVFVKSSGAGIRSSSTVQLVQELKWTY